MEQIYIPKQDYKVLVRCFTYNQSKYIEEALNGFAMQQTEFPFVCLVMDDCSTDGEQEVIKAWMERECDMVKAEYIDIELSNVIIVPHKSNTSCTFAFYFLKQNLYGSGKKKMNMVYPWRECCKYEAICEGDDYWIVPDKLEKQVKYLDNNPNCSLCFTNASVTYDKRGYEDIYKDLYNHLAEKDYDGKEILERWSIPTASVLYKIGIVAPEDKRFIYGDIVLFLTAYTCGSLHCINEQMVCYRRNANGVSIKKQNYKRMVEHYNAIQDHFGMEYEDIIKKHKARCLIMWFLSGRLKKESWIAFYTVCKEGLFLLFITQFIPVLYRILK